jgi:hypothetical protein
MARSTAAGGRPAARGACGCRCGGACKCWCSGCCERQQQDRRAHPGIRPTDPRLPQALTRSPAHPRRVAERGAACQRRALPTRLSRETSPRQCSMASISSSSGKMCVMASVVVPSLGASGHRHLARFPPWQQRLIRPRGVLILGPLAQAAEL